MDSSEVTALLESSQWLQLYGLERRKLTLSHLLACIGFKHSEAYVPGVKRPVEARYNRGLFPQYHSKDGTVHNLTASPEKIKRLSGRLLGIIDFLKKRLEFLTSGSRRIFDVIHFKRPVIILHTVPTHEHSLLPLSDTIQLIKDVVRDQLATREDFNIIWCGPDIRKWHDSCSVQSGKPTSVSPDKVADAVTWLDSCSRDPNGSQVSTPGNGHEPSVMLEALQIAMSDRCADSVYLFTEGSLSDSYRYLLQNKAQTSGIPINIVAFNCHDTATLDALQVVARISGGKCISASSRTYSTETGDDTAWAPFVGGTLSSTTASPSVRVPGEHPVIAWPESGGTRMAGSKPAADHHLVRNNVLLVWKELEEARNNLAEIEALAYDLPRPRTAPLPLDRAIAASLPKSTKQDKLAHFDQYMSSKEWLKLHGVAAQKLLLHDVLAGLAFRHCDSVVTLHHQMTSIGGDITPTSQDKLVGAKYCGNFAHFRWPDGSVVHLHVTQDTVRNYQSQMSKAIDSFQRRITWLRQGSRELFGTLIEDKVCLLIDASSSMKLRLDLVKAKLQILLQEQLRHKAMFNIVRFSSNAVSWRPSLVHVTSQSLQDAWRWIVSLSSGGSTNTLGALRLALSDPSVQAVYLLTDGRPDQPPEAVLAQVQVASKVPIHTISFNCADSQANHFLHQLAEYTGGRYHYFSDDTADVDGPRPYESEDIRLLVDEAEKAKSDLKRLLELREECIAVEKQGRTDGKSSQVQRPVKGSIRSKTASGRHLGSSSAHLATAKPRVSRQAKHVIGKSLPGEASDAHSNASVLDTSSRTSTRASAADSEDATSVSESNTSLDHTDSGSSTSVLSQTSAASFSSTATGTGHSVAKRKKASKAASTYISSEKWLLHHGLAVNCLTIMDALRPTVIEQRSKFVPILNKHVGSKVFDGLMPMRHIADESGDVSLVNPQAVDLKAYESKLSAALDKIEDHLNNLAWKALPARKRSRFSASRPVSFMENKDEFLEIFAELHWPVTRSDLMALVKEIENGRVYMEQSISLRASANEGQASLKKILSNPAVMKATLQTLSTSPAKTARKKAAASSWKSLDAKRSPPSKAVPKLVLARCSGDGFYYEANLHQTLDARNVIVMFPNGQEQKLAQRHLVTFDPAKPRAALMAGDHVLVLSSLPVPGVNENYWMVSPPSSACYAPAQVITVPRQASCSALHTLSLFSGSKITAFRADMIKISQSQYTFAMRYILSRAKECTSAQVTLHPPKLMSPVSASSSKHKHASTPDLQLTPSPENQRALHSELKHSEASVTEATRQHSGNDDNASIASTTSSVTRQRRFSTHTLQQLSEQTGKLHALHEELVATSARDKASISDQCQSLVRQHEEAMALSEHLKEQHIEQAKELQKQLVLENKTYQDSLTSTFQETSKLESQRNQLLMDEHSKQMAVLSQSLVEQSEMQKHIEEYQREQQKSFSVQRDQLISLVENLELQQKQQTEVATAEREHFEAEKSRQRDELSGLLAEMKHQQDELQRKQEELEQAQQALTEFQEAAAAAAAATPPLSPVNMSPENSLLPGDVSPLQASLSDLLDQLPEGSHLETITTDDGQEAVLVRHGDVGVLVSPTHAMNVPAQPETLPPSQTFYREYLDRLSVGEGVIARSDEDGWYFPGVVQDALDEDHYSVLNGFGGVVAVNRQQIISDNEDCENSINLGEPVLALHPDFVNSYAPGYVEKISSKRGLKVAFYDGAKGRVQRSDCYSIQPEEFTGVCAYIRQQEASIVGQDVVARYDKDGFYYPGKVMSQLGPSHTYAVQFTLSQVVHTQLIQHVFSRHTTQPEVTLGCRTLAPMTADETVYLPGWVSSDKDDRVTISFINGEQRRSVPKGQCFWMSTLYYNQSTQYLKKL